MTSAFAFPLGGATLVLPWLLALRVWRLIGRRRVYWVCGPLDGLIIVFLGWALISAARSPVPGVALESWALAVLGFVTVFQLALEVLGETPRLVCSLCRAFGLGAVTAAGAGGLVLFTRHTVRAQLPWLGGDAVGFGLMAGIFLALPLFEDSGLWARIAGPIIVIAAAGLVSTLSRGALYGLVAGGVAWVVLAIRGRHGRWAALGVLSILVGFSLAVSTPLVLRPLSAQTLWFSHLQNLPGSESRMFILSKTITLLLSKEGNNDRISVWASAWQVIRKNAWFGVGLGVFPFVIHTQAPEIPPGTPPHNIFLDLAAETGIPGAVAFLGLPAIALICALRQRDTYHIAGAATIIAMLAAEIRDNILLGFHMALGLFIVLALLVAEVGVQCRPFRFVTTCLLDARNPAARSVKREP